MNTCELATYVTAAACFIFDLYSEDELIVIITMLTQLNDTLRTMSAQQLFCNKGAEKLISGEASILINRRNTYPFAFVNEELSQMNMNNTAGNTSPNTSNRNHN